MYNTDVVSERTRGYFESGSAIRRMFNEGLRLRAKHGSDCVADLSLGNPTFDPPKSFTEAMRRLAGDVGPHAYMPNAGYTHVRERVASHLVERGFFPEMPADHVVMTSGAAGALNVVLATILDPGDEVIVLSPYFVEYRFYVETNGGVVRVVDTRPDFRLDLDAIESSITHRTRAIIVNTPNNPSGRLYTGRELTALAEGLHRKEYELGSRILLLSDEPYRDIVFDGRTFVSPASVYENSFMCYSWSKAFNISGERIGYIAVNPNMQVENRSDLLGSLAMCNRFLGFVNAPAFMQRVIAESLGAEIDIGHYRRKRDMICEALEWAGFEYAVPEGAFYIFVRTPGDEAEFVERAKEHLLLVVPGSDFGRPGYFRISFAAPEQTVILACEKLEQLAPVPLFAMV